MWIIQFINTAVILLIINMRLNDGLIHSLLKLLGMESFFFDGDYVDFDTQWYNIVGITIFTTSLINGLLPISALYLMVFGFLKRCWDRSCTCNSKKTKKLLQSEYEAVYIGSNIEYENRFSVLIAMIWVIMMFSTAMPILYLAGFILCFSIYWTDKALFVYYFRIPPRHGSHLANKARSIIEWSLLLHLFMGLYMISNPQIFNNQDNDDEVVSFLAEYAKFVGIGITIATGSKSSRFDQVHTILYSTGISIFTILFIIEKVSGTWSRLMGKICCCCLYRDAPEQNFSNDLFNDISSDKQSVEYEAAKRMHIKLNDKLLKEPEHPLKSLRSYYTKRIELKIKEIKLRISQKVNRKKVEGLDKQTTRKVFQDLAKKSGGSEATNILQADIYAGRMAGLHSYNILDSEEYIQTKKIERRIKKFDKKLRER